MAYHCLLPFLIAVMFLDALLVVVGCDGWIPAEVVESGVAIPYELLCFLVRVTYIR